MFEEILEVGFFFPPQKILVAMLPSNVRIICIYIYSLYGSFCIMYRAHYYIQSTEVERLAQRGDF